MKILFNPATLLIFLSHLYFWNLRHLLTQPAIFFSSCHFFLPFHISNLFNKKKKKIRGLEGGGGNKGEDGSGRGWDRKEAEVEGKETKEEERGQGGDGNKGKDGGGWGEKAAAPTFPILSLCLLLPLLSCLSSPFPPPSSPISFHPPLPSFFPPPPWTVLDWESRIVT